MDFAQSCFYNVEYSFFENVRLYNKPTFYVLYLSIAIDILSQYFEQQWRMVGFTVKKKSRECECFVVKNVFDAICTVNIFSKCQVNGSEKND